MASKIPYDLNTVSIYNIHAVGGRDPLEMAAAAAATAVSLRVKNGIENAYVSRAANEVRISSEGGRHTLELKTLIGQGAPLPVEAALKMLPIPRYHSETWTWGAPVDGSLVVEWHLELKKKDRPDPSKILGGLQTFTLVEGGIKHEVTGWGEHAFGQVLPPQGYKGADYMDRKVISFLNKHELGPRQDSIQALLGSQSDLALGALFQTEAEGIAAWKAGHESWPVRTSDAYARHIQARD